MQYASGEPSRYTLYLPGGRALPFEDVDVIWWRRPQGFAIHPEVADPDHYAFAQAESTEAFTGLWLAAPVFWINHPTRDSEAGRKAYQLRLASEIGLEIPETLITSNAADVCAFIQRQGPERTVYKAFSATASHWRETRLLKPEEMALLDNVRFAPVIFQEYVPADVDLRVTVVGEDVFPAAIHSQQTAYKHDFRMDMATARVEACTLPESVQRMLLELMRRLGLVYGAIDMRRTPEGRHVFLEINPAGQWLFVEDRTGQPITEALCSVIAAHCKVRPAPRAAVSARGG